VLNAGGAGAALNAKSPWPAKGYPVDIPERRAFAPNYIERQRPRLWKHIHRGAGRRPHESREESSFLFNELLHLIVRRAARNVHHAAKRVRARQSGDCFESCCAARKSRARERSASRPVRSWGSVKSPAFEKIKYNTRVADVSHTSVYRNPHQVSKVSSL